MQSYKIKINTCSAYAYKAGPVVGKALETFECSVSLSTLGGFGSSIDNGKANKQKTHSGIKKKPANGISIESHSLPLSANSNDKNQNAKEITMPNSTIDNLILSSGGSSTKRTTQEANTTWATSEQAEESAFNLESENLINSEDNTKIEEVSTAIPPSEEDGGRVEPTSKATIEIYERLAPQKYAVLAESLERKHQQKGGSTEKLYQRRKEFRGF